MFGEYLLVCPHGKLLAILVRTSVFLTFILPSGKLCVGVAAAVRVYWTKLLNHDNVVTNTAILVCDLPITVYRASQVLLSFVSIKLACHYTEVRHDASRSSKDIPYHQGECYQLFIILHNFTSSRSFL